MTRKVCIIGAGPAALAVVTALAEANIDVLEDVAVLDPGGRWLSRWNDQLISVGAAELRSPTAYHPHPDPTALEQFMLERGETVAYRDGFRLATVAQFAAFCEHLVREHGLDTIVRAATAVDLSHNEGAVTVQLDDGSAIVADRVIVANNPRTRRVPSWAELSERIVHASDVSLPTEHQLHGGRVAIVGGGMTAGHLALGAIERGASVLLLHRRTLTTRRLDTPTGWATPRSLAAFRALPDGRSRADAALAARDGGSMPRWMLRALVVAADSGKLAFLHGEPARVRETGSGVDIEMAGFNRSADRVWLATGFDPDLDDPLISTLVAASPAVHRRVPLLDQDLRWPETRVHLVGPLAMSVVGPSASNLHGHRWAAKAVARSFAR